MASLLALARAEQERAKTLLTRRLYTHGLTLVLGLVSLVLNEPLVYVAAVAALASEGLAWWLKYSAGEAHALAEDGRRRAMIARELGRDVDTLGTAQLLTEFSGQARRTAARWEDADYYAAVGEAGPERLRQALQESAFWSVRLYRAAGRRALLRLAGVASILVLVALLVTVLDAGEAGTLAARAATVTLATLVGVDELGLTLSLFSAGGVAGRVVHQLNDVDSSDVAQLLIVLADYAVATASATPIPTAIYEANHDAIEAAWRAR